MRSDFADSGALLNNVSCDKHVPEVECYNQTIKKRVYAKHNTLPFNYYPPVFTVEMVYYSVFWRSMFALRGSISKTQSLSEIVLGQQLDFNAHFCIKFSEYI